MPAAAAQMKPQSDHDILTALNADYINSVQHSDVKRFDEILAPEFYCSNPDGSLVDRAAFLKQTAKPVAITNLRAEDVLIRIFSSAHDLVREPVSPLRDHALYYCGSIPASRMILVHCATSALMRALDCSGVSPTGS